MVCNFGPRWPQQERETPKDFLLREIEAMDESLMRAKYEVTALTIKNLEDFIINFLEDKIMEGIFDKMNQDAAHNIAFAELRPILRFRSINIPRVQGEAIVLGIDHPKINYALKEAAEKFRGLKLDHN